MFRNFRSVTLHQKLSSLLNATSNEWSTASESLPQLHFSRTVRWNARQGREVDPIWLGCLSIRRALRIERSCPAISVIDLWSGSDHSLILYPVHEQRITARFGPEPGLARSLALSSLLLARR